MQTKKRIYFISALAMIITDQLSKLGFENYLKETGSIPVLGELLRFTLVYNPGVAFGVRLGGDFGRYLLPAISLLASIFISYYIVKLKSERKLELWAFSLVLGGAAGNMIDRFFYGKVIDFLDFDFPDLIMLRWPVFNLADSYVTVGMALLVIQYLWFDSKKEGKDAS